MGIINDIKFNILFELVDKIDVCEGTLWRDLTFTNKFQYEGRTFLKLSDLSDDLENFLIYSKRLIKYFDRNLSLENVESILEATIVLFEEDKILARIYTESGLGGNLNYCLEVFKSSLLNGCSDNDENINSYYLEVNSGYIKFEYLPLISNLEPNKYKSKNSEQNPESYISKDSINGQMLNLERQVNLIYKIYELIAINDEGRFESQLASLKHELISNRS